MPACTIVDKVLEWFQKPAFLWNIGAAAFEPTYEDPIVIAEAQRVDSVVEQDVLPKDPWLVPDPCQ